MRGIPKKNDGKGFLKQTCSTNLVWHCVTFCEHGQLKGWPPRCSSHMGAQSVDCNKSSRPQLRDKTLCFSAWDRFFASAVTNGWAWCNHNAEVVERAAAIRNLLLAGSGWLKFPKGVAGMDSLNKHVEQISFPQCVHHMLRTSIRLTAPQRTQRG